MFSLEALEQAIDGAGWTAQEHVDELINIARTAPKPVERMTAMRDLLKFVHECIEINKPQVKMTRSVQSVDEQGNRVTDTVEFTSRYASQGRTASDRVQIPGKFEGSSDGSFDAPDD